MTAISRWLREQRDRYHRTEPNKISDPEGIAATVDNTYSVTPHESDIYP